MINVSVIGIDQRVVFGTKGQMQNFLVLRMPNGREVRAPIDIETTKELVTMDANGTNGEPQKLRSEHTSWDAPAEADMAYASPAPPAQVSTAGLQPSSEQRPLQTAEEAETVEWAKLADEILSPAMKAAFMHLKMPARLTPASVRSIETEVMGKFGPEEWEEVLGPVLAQTMVPKVATPAPSRAAPPIGQVQWADGAPMVGGGRPSRTVPKTSMGYPIPNDGTIDPGEVVGGTDMDEDGVSQL